MGLPWWQGLRIHIAMQGTLVRSLVQEDTTCHWASGHVCQNYWAHTALWSPQVLTIKPMLQLLKPPCPRACTPQQKKLLQWEALTAQLESSSHSLQLEKAHLQQQSPSTAKNKYFLKVFHRYSTRDIWITTHIQLRNKVLYRWKHMIVLIYTQKHYKGHIIAILDILFWLHV